jgi:hypothetical protein
MEIILVALLLVAGIAAWLFYKKRDHASPKSRQPTLRIRGDGKYEFALVGVARFRSAIETICGNTQRSTKIVEAVLIPDDGGRDRKAIRVDVQGLTVGYLPAPLAESYRKRLVDSGYPDARSICNARISVRLDNIDGDPDYAVRLDLPQKRSND